MAIRTEIRDRVPLENVEIEYVRAGTRAKVTKPGFNRARLLDINSATIDMAAREPFHPEDKLTLTLHVKGVRDFLKLDVAVQKIARINTLKQPAYSVVMQYGKLTASATGAGPSRTNADSSNWSTSGTPATSISTRSTPCRPSG